LPAVFGVLSVVVCVEPSHATKLSPSHLIWLRSDCKWVICCEQFSEFMLMESSAPLDGSSERPGHVFQQRSNLIFFREQRTFI
jgi:hypothetical protein